MRPPPRSEKWRTSVPLRAAHAGKSPTHRCAYGRRLAACSHRHTFPRPNPQVGKLDPKRHLEKDIDLVMSANIIQTLGTMLDTVVF